MRVRQNLAPLASQHFHLRALGAEHQAGITAKKAVATPFFAPLHAFQEEGIVPAVNLPKGGDGRLHVRQDLSGDGDEIALPCQLAKRLQIGCVHGAASRKMGVLSGET